MKLNLSKFFNTKKTKLFWLYIVIGAVALALGIMLMPFWLDKGINVFFATWGYDIIKIIIAILVVLYLVFYLFKKVKRSKGTILILTLIEFILLGLVALGCILSQFNVLNLTEAGKILGFALWLRGVIEIFRAYYYQRGGTVKYSVFELIVALLMVTFGVFFMISNVITNTLILWIVTITIAILGLLTLITGILKNPKRK